MSTVMAALGGILVIAILALSFLFFWSFFKKRSKALKIKDLQSSRQIFMKENINPSSRLVHQNTIPRNRISANGIQHSKCLTKKNFPHIELLKKQEMWDSSDTDGDNEGYCINGHGVEINPNDGNLNVMGNKELPAIEFSLLYNSMEKVLKVTVIKVTNIPVKYWNNPSFVRVSLGRKKSIRMTKVCKHSQDPNFDEIFTFLGYNSRRISGFCLRLAVYVKRSSLRKDRLIGDYGLELSKLKPEILMFFSERLNPQIRFKKLNTLSSSFAGISQLFVVLQYKSSTEKFKVVICSAQNLPKSKAILFRNQEYYIIISLIQNAEVVECKESQPVIGSNPIWNESFIFTIPYQDINSYWLQFLIICGRMYSADGVMGQVLIGPDTTSSGVVHWQECMQPNSLESAKWHPIFPAKHF